MQYMMIQKQDRMVRPPERGWAILENGAVALVVIAVITVVLGGIYMLYDRKDAVVETNESANYHLQYSGVNERQWWICI